MHFHKNFQDYICERNWKYLGKLKDMIYRQERHYYNSLEKTSA